MSLEIVYNLIRNVYLTLARAVSCMWIEMAASSESMFVISLREKIR